MKKARFGVLFSMKPPVQADILFNTPVDISSLFVYTLPTLLQKEADKNGKDES